MKICLVLALALCCFLLAGAQQQGKGGSKGGEIPTEVPIPTQQQKQGKGKGGAKGGEIPTEVPIPTQQQQQHGAKGGELPTELPVPTQRQQEGKGKGGAKGGELPTELPVPTQRQQEGKGKGGSKGGEVPTEVPRPTERQQQQQHKGNAKGGAKGGEIIPTELPTPAPCVVDIDDFSRMLFAGIDMFATQNLFGLNTGTDDTMGVEYDTERKMLTLEVWGDKSYWYSFLADRACHDLSPHAAIRFVVKGDIPDPARMRVGIQIGKGEGCVRDHTWFAPWVSAVKRYDQVNDETTYDFSFDKFEGLTPEDLKNVLAIEISGFSRDQTHMKIPITHVQLVNSECALVEVVPTANIGGSQGIKGQAKGH